MSANQLVENKSAQGPRGRGPTPRMQAIIRWHKQQAIDMERRLRERQLKVFKVNRNTFLHKFLAQGRGEHPHFSFPVQMDQDVWKSLEPEMTEIATTTTDVGCTTYAVTYPDGLDRIKDLLRTEPLANYAVGVYKNVAEGGLTTYYTFARQQPGDACGRWEKVTFALTPENRGRCSYSKGLNKSWQPVVQKMKEIAGQLLALQTPSMMIDMKWAS